ncbi:MAG: LLM class F420-dependent oxidoreductase [Candidatus Binataceae bacterium]
MKIGIAFANSGPLSAPALFAHLAKTAEHFGIESIWTVEHVVIPKEYETRYPGSRTGRFPGGDDVALPDPLIPLAYAAAITTRLKLATGIVILPQRNPLYLAKEVATLDVLSNGRAILGIGSGWFKEEFDAVGVDFRARGSRTDEAIQAIRALWREPLAGFHGKHFNFNEVHSFPKPAQKGGVPIYIGGNSPAAIRRAARFGDGYIPTVGDPAKLKGILSALKDECARRGRNYDEIELSCLGRVRLDDVKALADLGVTRVAVPPPAYDADGLTRGLEKLANDVIARL